MKKYGLVLIVTLLLIVSAVFNYNLSKKLEVSTSQAGMLEAQLEEQKSDNEVLLENVSALVEELKETAHEVDVIQETLLSKEKDLMLIDDKLKAEGKIIEKIDALIAENGQWREELNTMTSKLNALEAEMSEETVIEVEVVETPPEDASWKQWVTDVQAIVDFVEGRVVELEEAVSILPALSLERIMIQKEIDFLGKTRSDLMTLQTDISDGK